MDNFYLVTTLHIGHFCAIPIFQNGRHCLWDEKINFGVETSFIPHIVGNYKGIKLYK